MMLNAAKRRDAIGAVFMDESRIDRNATSDRAISPRGELICIYAATVRSPHKLLVCLELQGASSIWRHTPHGHRPGWISC